MRGLWWLKYQHEFLPISAFLLKKSSEQCLIHSGMVQQVQQRVMKGMTVS